ncbi:hypothetical protein [Pseudactinotalea sp.]|uniref:hypothetical protein n=1 Tax=Pseudactinotalea sp. TaxID=1926260 RepID=UPI003B3ACE3D
MTRTIASTKLTRLLAAAALALTTMAGSAASASAAPTVTAAPTAVQAEVDPTGVGGGVGGWTYFSWYWTAANCNNAGSNGLRIGAWRAYDCRGDWHTTYDLYVLR